MIWVSTLSHGIGSLSVDEMKQILVFGYGSLLNSESRITTVASALDAQPCFTNDYRRELNVWDADGFTETNLDVAGIPHCAFNLMSRTGARTNGAAFFIDDREMNKLRARENVYKFVETECFDFQTYESLGIAITFVAPGDQQVADLDNEAQLRYIKISLDGAAQFGRRFFDEFVTSSILGKVCLGEISQLQKLVGGVRP